MIGFIGGGNMAEALIKGIRGKGQGAKEEIIVSEPMEERRKYLEQTYGIKSTSSNKEVAASCSIIILAVKPQNMETVINEIAEVITEDKTVVSIAAGISLSYLQSRLKTKRLIRVMPNTPALVQKGMSVMSRCEFFPDKDINTVEEIFTSVGRVITLSEKYMNAVTALSGSGPAFIAFFVESMIDAGINMGLSRESSAELAIQTLIGTAKLLEAGMQPDKLREMVTSPGGTTVAGLKVFVERDMKGMVSNAMQSALKRAEELGKKE